jgi:hypothetical protein
MASRPTSGTVVIERATADSDLFHVRPLRRRRVYTLPLSDVAAMVVRAIVMAETRTKRAEKKARRRGR